MHSKDSVYVESFRIYFAKIVMTSGATTMHMLIVVRENNSFTNCLSKHDFPFSDDNSSAEKQMVLTLSTHTHI